jgi:hypothetical protein
MLTPEQIADLRRNLSLLSPYHVEKFYTDSYIEAAPEKKPCPRVMQQLILPGNFSIGGSGRSDWRLVCVVLSQLWEQYPA